MRGEFVYTQMIKFNSIFNLVLRLMYICKIYFNAHYFQNTKNVYLSSRKMYLENNVLRMNILAYISYKLTKELSARFLKNILI